jgi:hypothetical protein
MRRTIVVLAVVVAAWGVVPQGASAQRSAAQKPGSIVFGTGFVQKSTGYHIRGRRSTFHLSGGGMFAWVAVFNQQAGSRTLTISIARVSGGTAESQVFSATVTLSDPRSDTTASRVPLALVWLRWGGPGRFVMRYFNGTTELAEGRFKLAR